MKPGQYFGNGTMSKSYSEYKDGYTLDVAKWEKKVYLDQKKDATPNIVPGRPILS